MVDTRWRISGGLGEPEDPVQKMTQGIGFPLRPVDNVPPPSSGEFLENIPIAEGTFMQWHGSFAPGVVYTKGSVVEDEGWLMIANRSTVDKAAPASDGTPEWSMDPVPAFNSPSDLSVVYSGHLYEFNTAGWVQGLRIWVPILSATTNYRIIVVNVTDPNSPLYTTIEEPVLNANDWTIIAAFNRIVTAGDKLLVYIDALDSGSDTVVAGGWTYSGASQSNPPTTASWNHPTQHEFLRIDKTDLDSTDRTSELLGMIPNTDIVFSETADPNYSITYRVTGTPVDQGTYVQMEVVLTDTGPQGQPRSGSTTTMNATVPVAQATDYVELPGLAPTPTWATVTGYLAFDGVDQGGAANGYGVDLYFDEAVISDAWDFMAIPPGG